MGKLSEINTGKKQMPPKVVIYGLEGIGKTTYAAQAPKPIFIPTEDGLGQIDCASFPLAKSYEDVLESLVELIKEEHDFKTVVIDSIDWLEPLVWAKTCQENGASSIEQVGKGFGKGYIEAMKYWREILSCLDQLRNAKKMNVILICHAKIKTINEPTAPPYDKYMLKLQDRASDMITEWADAVMYATYNFVVNNQDGKGKASAIGNERILHAVTAPWVTAKNRYGITESIPLAWDEFKKRINK